MLNLYVRAPKRTENLLFPLNLLPNLSSQLLRHSKWSKMTSSGLACLVSSGATLTPQQKKCSAHKIVI